MVDLVVVKDGIAWTDSQKVADKFRKPHKRVLEAIENLEKNFKNLMAENPAMKMDEYIFKETARVSRGRSFKSYVMNRNAFSILAMSFTGAKALRWKVDFIKAFNAMEQMLLHQKDLSWKQVREDSKVKRLEYTGCIDEFIEYCYNQGSENARHYYSNLTKMEYVALRLLEHKEKVPSKFRDTLDKMQLFMLVMAEHVANETIKNGMADGLHYKEIFLLAKQAVLKYADTVIFPQKQLTEVKNVHKIR